MSTAADSRISVAAAAQLVSMGAHTQANSQLQGAVALHNILEREQVAYLADEVGLGKTYVALATMALYRHHDPSFRVLVIAPKGNIQEKWLRDWQALTRHNWKVPDLRVRGAAPGPARSHVLAHRLSDLVYESQINDNRDMFARLTSFSFAVHGDPAEVARNVRRALPWIRRSEFPSQQERLRDFVAQAYNAALAPYDLVIIDEAHNLKHGVTVSDGRVGANVSLRNAVLSQMLGHPGVMPVDVFAGPYRPLAKRVLMLSATPIETSFRSLWNQLDLVGKAQGFEGLVSDDVEEAQATAQRFMIRRINELTVNGKPLTKNLYRRTWTRGGVSTFDEELSRGTTRERLTVALVQKRVSDVIGSRFGNSFQMGMLASFESFEQTALRSAEGESVFDGGEQSTTEEERQGADASTINGLAKSHLKAFGIEMAHPKMDSLIDDLSRSWDTGSKTLVFVRRIASVEELKRKLDERYDLWLFARLQRDLPAPVWKKVAGLRPAYQEERQKSGRKAMDPADDRRLGAEDAGGADTFFGWFFRGQAAPDDPAFRSAASIARSLNDRAGGLSTFFSQHLVSMVLGVPPAECWPRVIALLNLPAADVISAIEQEAAPFLPLAAGRRLQFDAVQYAVLQLLSTSLSAEGKHSRALLAAIGPVPNARPQPVTINPVSELETETFFTRLRDFPELKQELLGESSRGALRRDYLNNALLAGVARLGHSLIDLYCCVMQVTGGPVPQDAGAPPVLNRYLQLLEDQRVRADRSGAFHELQQCAENFELIRLQNLPETEREDFSLTEAAREIGNLLASQQPVVGLAGRVNRRAVRQFRMPGYPHAVICTEVLQEGEDLHTFCDRVVHYGVAWTPSAMEQRNGRVDRLYSLAERRFQFFDRRAVDLPDAERIQIQIPYLPDTIEVVQARRVLEGMHQFATLLHETADAPDKRVDLDRDIHRPSWVAPRLSGPLTTSFAVKPSDLEGPPAVTIDPDPALTYWKRLQASVADLALHVTTTVDEDNRVVFLSRQLGSRVQPMTLRISSRGALFLIRGLSPIGRVGSADFQIDVRSRVTATFDERDREYDLAVEGEVILGDPSADGPRLLALVQQLTEDADQAERLLTSTDLTLDEVQRTMSQDAS